MKVLQLFYILNSPFRHAISRNIVFVIIFVTLFLNSGQNSRRSEAAVSGKWKGLTFPKAGSIVYVFGALAQLGARYIRIVEVVGSNPICSTKNREVIYPDLPVLFFCILLVLISHSNLVCNQFPDRIHLPGNVHAHIPAGSVDIAPFQTLPQLVMFLYQR